MLIEIQNLTIDRSTENEHRKLLAKKHNYQKRNISRERKLNRSFDRYFMCSEMIHNLLS